jgi:4-nitrophenol 2-monooxygenase / 4-nitrocatechol 4-monooxygenase, reductase component
MRIAGDDRARVQAVTDDDGLRSLPSERFREVIGHFASGVTVITALLDGRAHGTTASAVTSLSLEPPMVLICMNKTSETGRAISVSGCFAINVLSEDQHGAALRFAGKGDDKFAGVATTPGVWSEPLLDEALATLECRVVEDTTGGTHWVFLAEVDHASSRPGTPLAYYRGEFHSLSKLVSERLTAQQLADVYTADELATALKHVEDH